MHMGLVIETANDSVVQKKIFCFPFGWVVQLFWARRFLIKSNKYHFKDIELTNKAIIVLLRITFRSTHGRSVLESEVPVKGSQRRFFSLVVCCSIQRMCIHLSNWPSFCRFYVGFKWGTLNLLMPQDESMKLLFERMQTINLFRPRRCYWVRNFQQCEFTWMDPWIPYLVLVMGLFTTM